jgi:hypothetical protein
MPRSNDARSSRESPDFDDDPPPMPCPYCLAVIHEDSVRCPRCGNYLSEEDAPPSRPWWVLVGLILALAVSLLLVFLV